MHVYCKYQWHNEKQIHIYVVIAYQQDHHPICCTTVSARMVTSLFSMLFRILFKKNVHFIPFLAKKNLSPALMTPIWNILLNIFPNIAAPKLPINIPRNSCLYSLVSSSVVLLAPFINKPESSEDLTIFISSISSFEIISVVFPDPW